jgi:hypothetical protein
MTFKCQKSKQHQGDQNRIHQADSGDFRTHKLEKIGAGAKWKKSTQLDSEKCMLHIRREVQQDTFVNSALFRFTKGPVLKNITLW